MTDVLLVTPDYPPMAGGIATLLRGLADGAKRCRFEVLALESPQPAAASDAASAPVIRSTSNGRFASPIASEVISSRATSTAPAPSVRARPTPTGP